MAANWKMNQSIHKLESYAKALQEFSKPSLSKITEKLDIVLGVPAPFLEKAENIFRPKKISISAQNIHWEESGAFTGETSAYMLEELGVPMTILGHSERRTLFHETNKEIKLKFEKALSKNITPILCIGEKIEERQAGKTFSILEEQLSSCLSQASLDGKNFLIAYEPVWAIGTGLTATPEQAHEAHKFIRDYLEKKISKAVAEKTKILYGGSMKQEVTRKLLSSTEIDGGLIGGASLEPETFASMLNIAYELSP